jgi:F-type H+-transporting ATPase subunit b
MKTIRSLGVLALFAVLLFVPVFTLARAQEQPAEHGQSAQAAPEGKGVEGEKAEGKKEGEAEQEEEENANLKHSPMVGKLAKMVGYSVHGTHLLVSIINFAIVVVLIYWLGRKIVPPALKSRNESIQKALEEARAASQEANKRLAAIETRLQQLDVEIGQMQMSAEKEGEAEEERIRKATEEDLRKVVQSAEQEIAAAAKQARRELTAHTADLAIALATKQIQVDPATDQTLVRSFAGQLTSGKGGKDGN